MPYNGTSAGAGAFDAIQNAIQMFMGLRQQKLQNTRQAGEDLRAQKELDLRTRAQQLDEGQQQNTQDQQKRALIAGMAGEFGGQAATPETAAAGHSLGMADYFQPDPAAGALPASRLPTAVDQNFMPMNSPSQAPVSPPGTEIFREGQSERERIANIQAMGRFTIAGQNNETRLAVAQMQSASRAKALAQSAEFQRGSQALRARGLNLSAEQLALAYAKANENADVDQFNMQYRKDMGAMNSPFFWLQLAQSGGLAAGSFPTSKATVPDLPYFQPPANPQATPSASPSSGLGDWEQLRPGAK